VPPPTGDRPTEFIPRVESTGQPAAESAVESAVESTRYIPRVEDYGGYPTQDPDAGRPRTGGFGDPAPPTDADITAVTDPITDGSGRPAAGRRDRPPVVHKETGRTVLRTVGEVLITMGMVVLLFVVYELYITNIFSAQKQANATSALNKEWDTVTGPARVNHYDVTDGQGFAKLYIPALGRDFHFTVIEGTTQPDLAIGPGHYPGTALPGQPGNMAIAGHRVGEGAPFDDLGLVQSCDAIVVETASDWYVYRMLPMAGEVADWSSTKGATAQCSGPNGEGKVAPLTGLYARTVGQEIVLPTEGDVVAPVPHYPGATLSAGQQVSLLTLTTCNPKFSAAQRMIIHAVLVKDWKKDPANPTQSPPELKETT
jgi:sortase (surface protein transpeptidase)